MLHVCVSRFTHLLRLLVLHFLLLALPLLLCLQVLHHLVPLVLLIAYRVHFFSLANGLANLLIHSFIFFFEDAHPIFDQLRLRIHRHPLVLFIEERAFEADAVLVECSDIGRTEY